MDAHKLCRMANEIASFFDGDPDKKVAAAGVASHLKRFWDPRMRRALVAWVDGHGGEGLEETALAAVRTHRDELLPAAPAAGAPPGPR